MSSPPRAKNSDTGLGAYFHQNLPLEYGQNLRSRAVNALRRAGIMTMEKLDAVPSEDIERIRLLGEKGVELVLFVREKYRKER